MKPRILSFVIGLLGFVVLLLGGCSAASTTTPVRIDITSDRSLILARVGEEATVAAIAVDDDGGEIDGAVVRWTSSDPDAVRVDPGGLVTAMVPVGSAVLSAEYQGIQNIVTAVVVELRDETTLVATDKVLAVSETRDEIRLVRTAEHEVLGPGSIVVNGNAEGFLSRVVAARVTENEVVLDVVDAAIVDAVRELDLIAASPPLVFEDEFAPSVAGAPRVERHDGSVAASTQALASVEVECKLQTMIVNVGFDGLNLAPKVSLRNEIRHRIRDGVVEELEVAIVGDLGVDAALAALTITGGLKGKFTCEAELRALPFLPVPVFGSIALAGTATPGLSVELEAQYAGVQFSANGLRATRGERIHAGVRYDRTSGYSLVGSQQTTASSVEFVKWDRAPQDRFSAKVEPGLGVKLGIGILAGGILVGSADVIGAKVFGGVEVAVSTPLDPHDVGYTGPRWNVFDGINADVNPLRENFNAVDRLLGVFGLNGAGGLLGVDTKLFEVKNTLLESPTVSVTASPESVEVGDSTMLSVTAMGADSGDLVALGFPIDEGAPRELQTGIVDAQGGAEVEWTPSDNDVGIHRVKVLLYDDVFGDVDLPYAGGTPTVTVTEDDDDDDDPDDDESNLPCSEGPFELTVSSTLEAEHITRAETTVVRGYADFGTWQFESGMRTMSWTTATDSGEDTQEITASQAPVDWARPFCSTAGQVQFAEDGTRVQLGCCQEVVVSLSGCNPMGYIPLDRRDQYYCCNGGNNIACRR